MSHTDLLHRTIAESMALHQVPAGREQPILDAAAIVTAFRGDCTLLHVICALVEVRGDA